MKSVNNELFQHIYDFSEIMSHEVFDLVANIQHAIWWTVDLKTKNLLTDRMRNNETNM